VDNHAAFDSFMVCDPDPSAVDLGCHKGRPAGGGGYLLNPSGGGVARDPLPGKHQPGRGLQRTGRKPYQVYPVRSRLT